MLRKRGTAHRPVAERPPVAGQVVTSILARLGSPEARGYADRSSIYPGPDARNSRSWHLSRVVKSGGCPGV